MPLKEQKESAFILMVFIKDMIANAVAIDGMFLMGVVMMNL
jgi:hypothetical protein